MKLTVKTPDPEGIEDVKSATAESLGEPTDEPVKPAKTAKSKPADDLLQVRVMKRARNYSFVYADNAGERIAVKVARNTRKSIIGKTVTVRREIDAATGEANFTLIPS